jgi:hypothetical protein
MSIFSDKIPATSTVYDFSSRDEVQFSDVLNFIEAHEAVVELSSWKEGDTAWPESDREGRNVVTITPTQDGIRDDMSQWVIVVE